jgi:ribosomal protein S21
MARKVNIRVDVHDSDSFERAFSKFNEIVNAEGIIKRYKEKSVYTKPSMKRHQRNQKRKRELFIENLKTSRKRGGGKE